jgi:ribonuclease HI
MPWSRWLFKQSTKVFARVDAQHQPITDKGFVEIRYQLTGRSYFAGKANLAPLPEGPGELLPDEAAPPVEGSPTQPPQGPAKRPAAGAAKAKTKPASAPTPEAAPPPGTVIIYADGACSGNPGPAGLGVYWRSHEQTKELSEYLGQGTNNIAELTAIQRALEMCPDPGANIYLYTDSAYSIGVLTQGWRAKANQELIADVKSDLRRYPRLSLRKVAGHAGIFGNERADTLARVAVETRDSYTQTLPVDAHAPKAP